MTKIKDSYRKTYQLIRAVEGRKSIKVTVPYEFVEREARRRGLDVDEFIERFQAVALYDNFEGLYYVFEETDKGPVAPK